MRHCHKPWFDAKCHIMKRELRPQLKANHDSHAVKHQPSNLKKLLKNKRICWETARAQHMCMFAKVDVLSFWKKYRPRAPVVDKISAVTFLEGFPELIGQSLPPIQLRIDHSTQVIEPPPNHILNTDITLTELLQALKKLQRNCRNPTLAKCGGETQHLEKVGIGVVATLAFGLRLRQGG